GRTKPVDEKDGTREESSLMFHSSTLPAFRRSSSPSRFRGVTLDARWARRVSRSSSAFVLVAALLAACGSDPVAPDASVPLDAGTDAGVDAGAIPEADAGPPPIRPLALEWTSRVTSAQTLGGVAEARLALAG